MRDGHVIDTKPVSEFTRNEMISMMVGRTIENEYPPRPAVRGRDDPRDQGHSTPGSCRTSRFTLHKGEILGLVGLVGSGRTELVRALFGADKVPGQEHLTSTASRSSIHSPNDAINLGLAMVPEDRKLQGLVLAFSVEQNISLAGFLKFG